MAETAEKKQTPAYVNFSSLDTFVTRMEGVVPDRIDKSLMTSMSGSGQAALKTSLRYLGLTDEEERPTDLMREFIKASEAGRKDVLKKVLERSYPFMTDGSLNVENATMSQLEDWFREQGISGTTVEKSVKFFLDAAAAAEIPLGPYLSSKSRRRSSTPRKKSSRRRQASKKGTTGNGQPEKPNDTMQRFEVPLPGKGMAAMILPKDLDDEDWKMLNQMFGLFAERLIQANENDVGNGADDES